MLLVPLIGQPSQTLTVTLNGQTVQIAVYQLGSDTVEWSDGDGNTFAFAPLFWDLLWNGTYILQGSKLVINEQFLVAKGYFGFSGDFVLVDTQGDAYPKFAGLGTRWQLVYLTPQDIANA